MKRSGSRTSLFLMEMIIVILFFALTSAICIGLFANAHLDTVRSDELARGVMLLQSEAEQFKAGVPAAPGVTETGYDGAWNEVALSQNPRYICRMEVTSGDALDTAELCLLRAGEEDAPIFELSAKRLREVAQ